MIRHRLEVRGLRLIQYPSSSVLLPLKILAAVVADRRAPAGFT